MAVCLVGDAGAPAGIPGALICGAESDPRAVSEKIGSGGTAVLGSGVPDTAALASALLKSGINVMVLDVLSCSTGQWQQLESVASKHRVRLLCGAQISRFGALGKEMSGRLGRGTYTIAALCCKPYCTAADDSLAVPVDIALSMFESIPHAVFAAREKTGESEQGGADSRFASAMLRFGGGSCALIASSLQDADPSLPDADVKISSIGTGELQEARLHLWGRNNPSESGRDAVHASLSDALNYLSGSGDFPTGDPAAEKTIASDACSSLARTMRAIIVSLNTGAPVYIDKT